MQLFLFLGAGGEGKARLRISRRIGWLGFGLRAIKEMPVTASSSGAMVVFHVVLGGVLDLGDCFWKLGAGALTNQCAGELTLKSSRKKSVCMRAA
jgi:hypothetical protein